MDILVQFFGRRRSTRVAEFARRTLEHALDRFAGRVRDIRVRIRDENAQRGGQDHRCSLELRLVDGGRLHLHDIADGPEPALHTLARRANRMLGRRLHAARRRRDRAGSP